MSDNTPTLEQLGLSKEELGIINPDLSPAGNEISQTTKLDPPMFDDATQSEIDRQIELEKLYGSKALQAGALGAARGLTFGLSDQFLKSTKLYTPEELNEIKERNKLSSLTGEIAGTGAGLVAEGPLALLGTGVKTAAKAGSLVEKSLAKVLSDQASKPLARKLIESATKASGAATEGALYGVGSLISEEALGNAEINAENLIASAGTGALFGGVSSGVFDAGKALVPLARKAGEKVSSKLSKFSDPQKASFELAGISDAKAATFKQYNPNFAEELPTWLGKKLKSGEMKNVLPEDVNNVITNSGTKIKQTINKIDEIAANIPEILPTKKSVYSNIAKQIDDNFIKPFENTPGYKELLKPVRSLRNEYIQISAKPGRLKATELRQLRQKVDDLIYKEDTIVNKNPTIKTDANYKIRSLLNEEIEKLASNVSTLSPENSTLVEDLLSANKDYNYAKNIQKSVMKKAEKNDTIKDLFSLKDLALAGAAAASGDLGIAAAALGTKKLLESDIRRKYSILKAIDKQNASVDTKVSKSISDFVKLPTLPLQQLSTKALLATNLSIPLDEKSKKPKDRLEAYENVKKNVNTLSSDPEKLQKLLAFRSNALSNAAPTISSFAMQTAAKGLDFLQQKLPKPINDNPVSNLINKKEYKPSSIQLAKFERYLQAVESPMSVLDDLKAGQLTREAAEAIKYVYPNLFQKIQDVAMAEIQKNPEKLSYSKRLQLGILLDIESDPSLEPKTIASLQTNFTPPGENQKATPYKAENLNIAEREETKQNRIAQR